MPHFWLGLLLITWFAVDLHWLPAIGYVSMRHPIANLEHMLMPVVVLGTGFAAVLMRQTRSSMLDSLGSDYVRTARAKGLSEWSVVGSHALRNSLITVATVIALDFGILISGRGGHRDDLRHPRLRPALDRRDQPARLPDDPGRSCSSRPSSTWS